MTLMNDIAGTYPNLRRTILWALSFMAAASVSDMATVSHGKSEPDRNAPHRNEVPGIENVWRLDDRIWSGGEPGGLKGLEKLKALGIRTIVSVDGAAPDVEAARKMGLRYVHIPIGYDGVDAAAQLRLVRTIAELPGPVFVHCHHGKHRGPAAAAVMARAGRGWSADQAERFMTQAGTSPDYPGLFASVRSFRQPTAEALRANAEPLPEAVEVPALVELMVDMDERFDRMKDWLKTSEPGHEGKGNSAIDPRQEAIQLRELTRESARLPECREKPPEFRKGFDELESDLKAWIEALDETGGQSANSDAVRKRFEGLIKQASGRCSACHRAFRDQ